MEYLEGGGMGREKERERERKREKERGLEGGSNIKMLND